MEGLRQGRKRWPDCFIAVWATDLTEPLATLVREGTVDLLILECYTHAPASLGPGPFAQSLPGVYHRVGLVQKARLLDKAISRPGSGLQARLTETKESARVRETISFNCCETLHAAPPGRPHFAGPNCFS